MDKMKYCVSRVWFPVLLEDIEDNRPYLEKAYLNPIPKP